jgi:hypothetical protein
MLGFGGHSPPGSPTTLTMQQPSSQMPPLVARKNTSRNGTCRICSKQFGNAGIISCHSCDTKFHQSCTGVTEEFYKFFIVDEGCPWFCHYCEMKMLQDTKTTTNLDEIKQEVHKAIDTQFESLRANIYTNKQELEFKMKQLEQNLKAEINAIKTTRAPPTMNEDTEAWINFLESQLKKKNLIISGVPESPTENLRDIIIKIGQTCGLEVETNNIEEVLRLKGRPRNAQQSTNTQRNESAPILVKFFTENTKNQLFDGYISLIKSKILLKCSSIGMTSEKRIFLNHHLTPALRKIQERALLLQKANMIEKINTKNNSISVKIKGKWNNVTTNAQLTDLIDYQKHKDPHVSQEKDK